jgi:hypothetical protein
MPKHHVTTRLTVSILAAVASLSACDSADQSGSVVAQSEALSAAGSPAFDVDEAFAASAADASDAESSDSYDTAAANDNSYIIFPARPGDKCLEVDGASTSNRAQVQIWTCPTNQVTPTHRRWIFRRVDDRYVRLVNAKSKKCANIKGSSDVNGTKIVQYTCGDSETRNDQWEPHLVSEGHPDYYEFRSKLNPSKCLNVQGGGDAPRGTDLILWPCNQRDNALFTWIPSRQN